MASLKTIIRKLKEGHRVLVFPEGERTDGWQTRRSRTGHRPHRREIRRAVIQPVSISGAREALPRGSARIRFARITVTVGPPIRLTPEELKAAKGKEDYDRIANRIMAAIAAL